MITVIIPMAGRGSRFADAGFSDPKPLIEVAGKSLAEISITTLGLPDAKFVFITRSFEDPADNDKLTEIFIKNCKNFVEVRVDSEHLGAAHSALYAEKYVDKDDELIVTNCDQSLRWDVEKFLKDVRSQRAHGAIVLHKSSNPQHSYASLEGARITKIAEKNPISDNALVGVHYWKQAKDFFETARKVVKDYKEMGYSEPYVSLTYNILLINKIVVPFFLTGPDRYYCLGTPSDIDNYLNMGDKVRLHFDEINYSAVVKNHVMVSSEIDYSILEDVEITLNDKKDSEIYFENAFLFNANEKSFYHSMADVLGQFLTLQELSKTKIDPVYIEINNNLSLDTVKPFMKELIDYGTDSFNIINDKETGKLKIKNLFVISPRDYSLFYKLFMNYIPQILTEQSHPGNPEYISKILRNSANKIMKHVSHTADARSDRKIFFQSSNGKIGDGSGDIDETHKRFASKEEYDKVVEAFAKDGYEIVDPESLSVLEQVEAVRQCVSIATVKGSNSVHSIFARPDTEFIMVNLKKENTFPHEIIVKSFINNPTFIDEDGKE